MFQHTAARRRLGLIGACIRYQDDVSTHSRPKAAGWPSAWLRRLNNCFNTQPPEGGWARKRRTKFRDSCFNTQPPEGGWVDFETRLSMVTGFNTQPPEGGWLRKLNQTFIAKLFQHTAARRRLAFSDDLNTYTNLFQHTAARRRLVEIFIRQACGFVVSTHSRPKAAGLAASFRAFKSAVSTHSRPKAAGRNLQTIAGIGKVSTHSRPKAAGAQYGDWGGAARVSTHSRPKAAGVCCFIRCSCKCSFNTQPPEGGWP